MIKIKLLPTGKKNSRQYRIVVANENSKLTGRFLELIGTYNPHSEKGKIALNKELYQSWLTKGAQPTQTVKDLVSKSK